MTPLVIGIDPSFTACGLSDGISHATVAAPPAEIGEERAAATRRRSNALVAEVIAWTVLRANDAHSDGGQVAVYIEAPMLGAADANHLYELGWLMAKLDVRLRAIGIRRIVEVPAATLRKFIGLKGNAGKIEVPVRVLKRFGVEFDGDRGADKAFAYLLHRYGLAVESGEIEHVPTLARGQKTVRKRAPRRKAA